MLIVARHHGRAESFAESFSAEQLPAREYYRLWGFDVHLEIWQGDKLVNSQHVPPKNEPEREGEFPRLDLVIPPI